MNAVPLRARRRWPRLVVVLIALCGAVVLALMWWWDKEPAPIDPVARAQAWAAQHGRPLVPGVATAEALVGSVDTLLDKRGGYLSNDKLPPGVLMDNVPNWEFGVLTASRDLARALRNDFARSQTQSTEDPDLAEADPLLSSPNDRWLLPRSEGQYRQGAARIEAYLERLTDADQGNAVFYARADNLADYLGVASARLGSLSQRLSASVGQLRLPGEIVPGTEAPPAAGSAPRVVKTPWTKIDDNFYEARGYSWALLVQLRAFQRDFAPVLRDKNAEVGLKQVIRELEEAQTALGSPVVLNGRPFGFFANHSLVMANYVSRANAALIDLRELLRRG